MRPGHAAFGKAASAPPKHPGRGKEVGGGLLVANAAANAPVLHVGTKDPLKVVSASPKKQPGRYQGELVHAMKQGKVDSNSTLRVLKTPSGRYLNAGGTHRHVAREAMGQPTKVEVKPLGFEPKQSLVERVQRRGSVTQLKRASRRAVAGKPMKPVSSAARIANVHMAEAADINDDALWHGIGSRGIGTAGKDAAKIVHGARMAGAGIHAGLGGALIGAGVLEHRHAQRKVSKAMDGHAAFEISKRDRDTSFGRTLTGAVFPGFHAAVAGKPGHKLKAAAYELGGGLVGSTPGSAVGTHFASKKGHYRPLKEKVAKRDFSAGQRKKLAAKGDALPDGSFPIKSKGDLKNAEKLEGHSKHPAEVAALIERKKAELSKAATGHDAFLLEDVEKAIRLGSGMQAVRGLTALAGGAAKSMAPKAGGFLKPKIMTPGGGLTTGAKVVGGAAGMGVGYKAGMGIRHKLGGN